MIPERAPRCGVVILGANSDDDAAIAQRQNIALETLIGLAGCIALSEQNPAQTVVADDAAPQRIVEVEHQAAAREAADRGHNAAHVVGVQRHEVLIERQFREIPLPRAVPVGKPDSLGNGGYIEQLVGGMTKLTGEAA